MLVIAIFFVLFISVSCLSGAAVVGTWSYVTVRKMLKEIMHD